MKITVWICLAVLQATYLSVAVANKAEQEVSAAVHDRFDRSFPNNSLHQIQEEDHVVAATAEVTDNLYMRWIYYHGPVCLMIAGFVCVD